MEHNAETENLSNDLRTLILLQCDIRTALRLSQASKVWRRVANVLWKKIYFNNFTGFTLQPSPNAEDWKEEIEKKIKLFGWDFERYRYVGKVKINYNIDTPVDLMGDKHIHKRLELRVNDQLLPSMGYFGENDVCFGDWIKQVFKPLFQKFDADDNHHYWDFCDQGMPAFDFVKEGSICKLSVVEGCCGGGPDPSWQNVTFYIEELRSEYLKFLQELHDELLANYGEAGKAFWARLKLEEKDN